MHATIPSEKARQIWGELIDTTLAGQVTTITRRKRPVAVLVNAQAWAQMVADQKKLRMLEGQQEAIEAVRRIDRGEEKTVTHAELLKLMKERRANVAAVGD
jgi:prevent-host-death family protein